jgi:hypothetical protein
MSNKKTIYKNIDTGKRIVTSEKLDSEHWEKVGEWRVAQMQPSMIRAKKASETVLSKKEVKENG